MTAIDEIKSRIDIVDLVSETVQLRRAGKNYTGFCPFHPNTRTPSFVVFPETGTWRCFGACNEGGDIFRFVMKKEGWDFSQALHFLAEKAGVKLETITPQKEEEREEFERLRALLEEAVTFYRFHLLETPAGKPALEYLYYRGLTRATIEAFGLGYAPEGWDNALKYFTGKKYSIDDLRQAGLLSESEDGRVFDRFRHRIMIPIRDVNGKMTGFGARILNPQDMPKFLNSPQTPLFDKGKLLYGLDRARKAIRQVDQAVIVEGYLDVIALHQAGFENAVSPMGTALTEDQLRLLKRFTRRIVLALDPDAAGQKATLRGLEVARQAMDQSTEVVFDARGLLRHEARLQADLRVVTLPEGKDPDDLVLSDPEAWKTLIANARPVVIHVMETLVAGQNLEDPKVKSEIAAQVLPLIEDIGNPVEREDYRQRLARLLRVDERAFVGMSTPRAERTPRRRREPAPATAKPPVLTTVRPTRALEEQTLRLLLHFLELLSDLDRFLQQNRLARLGVMDFEQADHQQLMRVILDAMNQDEYDVDEYVRQFTPESLQEKLSDYLKPLGEKEISPQEAFEQLVRTILRLRELHIREVLDQLRFLSAEGQGDSDFQTGLLESMKQSAEILRYIHYAQKQPMILP